MQIYIDTHVAVWLHDGNVNRFSDTSMRLLDESSVRVSPMVILELQYLFEIKRLAVEPDLLITRIHDDFGVKECDGEFALISKEARKIEWTRDPFDRIITASATLFDVPLVTADQNILKHYSKAVW